MKKYLRTEKYFQHSKRVARKALIRSFKRQRFLRNRNRLFYKKNINVVRGIKNSDQYKQHVCAPVNCCFLENTERVIAFLTELESLYEKNRRVYVVLKKVEKFDYGTIALLLSIVSMFKLKGIGFDGNFPSNEEAKALIIESGFFNHIYEKDYAKVYISGKDNQIVTHSDTNVSPTLGPQIMAAASTTVWGEKRISSGFHSVLMELMQNTNNHAATGLTGEKHWWLSVNHDKDNKKVSFAFIDHGVGILTSLDRKPPDNQWHGILEKAKTSLGALSNESFLKELIAGKIHETVTKKTYRGKGLPNIKRMLDYGQINNLHVISNNVCGNVEKGEYRLLTNSFKGTFFYWELCETNITKPWTINI